MRASDFDELLRRKAEEGYGAGELLHEPRLFERRRHRVDGGYLEVVPACVRRAGVRCGERVLAADDAVQLAYYGYLRPFRAARHIGAQSRARESALNVEAEPFKRLRKLVRGARLEKSQLRMSGDVVRESLGLFLDGIDGFAQQSFHFVLFHKHSSLHKVFTKYLSIIQYPPAICF